MKDNMVQELLLRALLGQNPTANPKQQVNNYQHQTNMNNMLERWIKEHMSQWFWVHDRWKK